MAVRTRQKMPKRAELLININAIYQNQGRCQEKNDNFVTFDRSLCSMDLGHGVWEPECDKSPPTNLALH